MVTNVAARARKRFGRITIANSDAGAIHLTSCAFDQAYRAVDELNPTSILTGPRG